MRLVPLAGAIAALAGLAALPLPGAGANTLARCPNENTFVVAVYVKGGSCGHAYAVVSRWNAERCMHKANPCRVAHDWGAPIGHRTYECNAYSRIDHRDRHYYAIMCLNHDRPAAVR